MVVELNMKMTQQPDSDDRSDVQGNCDRCGTLILRFRGQNDLQCHTCGAHYNCFGQRLRDDLHSRPNFSEFDDELGDMEGYEDAMIRSENRYPPG